jgi:hypothetical protein
MIYNSNNKDVAPRCAGSPIQSVGPTADFYLERAEQVASACAAAMRAGDIMLANELYERGVNALMNHLWHAKLAKVVGRDFSVMNKVPQQ